MSSSAIPISDQSVGPTVDTTLAGVSDESRHRTLIFRLNEGQLIALGMSLYPAANTQRACQRPVGIAIIGGMGKYTGAGRGHDHKAC